MLSDEFNGLKNVYLLQGDTLVHKGSPFNKEMSSVEFISATPHCENFSLIEPNLIIVAEGVKSKTRESLSILFPSVKEKKDEFWCTGVVDLKNVMDYGQIPSMISVFQDIPLDSFAIGIFRNKYQDIFLNIKKSEANRSKSNEECIQESAYEFLKREADHLDLQMPESSQKLLVNRDKSKDFKVVSSKAEHFYYGNNLVLIGDTAGNGTPMGGLGTTFAASVYIDALNKLTDDLYATALDRKASFELYNQRISEIVDFWHFSY
jgi:2-polyprenyl-6-methoxyphenol hydroxylase-like FAD-dependent oxidoreductase